MKIPLKLLILSFLISNVASAVCQYTDPSGIVGLGQDKSSTETSTSPQFINCDKLCSGAHPHVHRCLAYVIGCGAGDSPGFSGQWVNCGSDQLDQGCPTAVNCFADYQNHLSDRGITVVGAGSSRTK